MSKKTKNKKLLIGSALAGLMVAAPGLSVTAGSMGEGSYFQAVQLETGYRLAQAEEEKKDEAKKDEAKKDEAKKDEAKKDEAKKDEAKKDAKKGGSGSCGAGACG